MPKLFTTDRVTIAAGDVTDTSTTPTRRLMCVRTQLTVPFDLLIVVPVLVIASTSLHTGLQAVDMLSRQ